MFLPEDHPPFEDEEKAEETRLCASRDDREDVRANISTSRRRSTSSSSHKKFYNEDIGKHRKGRRRQFFLYERRKELVEMYVRTHHRLTPAAGRALPCMRRTHTTTTPYSTTLLPQNIRILSEYDDRQIISKCPSSSHFPKTAPNRPASK